MLVKGSLVLQAHWLFPVHFSPSDTGLLNRVIDFIGTDNIQQVSKSPHIPQVFSYRIKAKLNLKMNTQSVPLLKWQWIKEKVFCALYTQQSIKIQHFSSVIPQTSAKHTIINSQFHQLCFRVPKTTTRVHSHDENSFQTHHSTADIYKQDKDLAQPPTAEL